MRRGSCIPAPKPGLGLVPAEDHDDGYFDRSINQSNGRAPYADAESLFPGGDQEVSRAPRKNPNLDGGWAWVVLVSSFFIHVIVFGILMAMGIFYSEFLDEFGRGPVATSWLIAANCSLGSLSGEHYIIPISPQTFWPGP